MAAPWYRNARPLANLKASNAASTPRGGCCRLTRDFESTNNTPVIFTDQMALLLAPFTRRSRYHLQGYLDQYRSEIVPKRSLEVLLDVSVDRTSEVPLHRQVYLGIRRLVLTGRLSPGSRLPSTRHLANDLRLSRTTVLDAFEQLIFEGYLEGKIGSGTRVSSQIPRDVYTLASAPQQNPIPIVRRKPRIARRALVHSFRQRLP